MEQKFMESPDSQCAESTRRIEDIQVFVSLRRLWRLRSWNISISSTRTESKYNSTVNVSGERRIIQLCQHFNMAIKLKSSVTMTYLHDVTTVDIFCRVLSIHFHSKGFDQCVMLFPGTFQHRYTGIVPKADIHD